MRTKHPLLTTSLATTMLLVAACGSDDSTTTDSDTTDSDTDATSLTYPLVDTGQSNFYDNEGEIDQPSDGDPYVGQDAAFQGNEFALVDNGDGTVSDEVTGLLWEQDPTDNGTVWNEAVDYCEALTLGGSDDWRIPSLKELFSISDFGTGWPYIDTEYFYLVEAATEKDQQFWTSNYYEVDTELAAPDQAFGVNHATGHIKAYPDGEAGVPDGAGAPEQRTGEPEGAEPSGDTADNDTANPPPPGEATGAPDEAGDNAPPAGEATGAPDEAGDNAPPAGEATDSPADASPASKYVRCVSGDFYGINDFVDNDDGTISDDATGLMWTQADSGEGIDWAAALDWAVTANEENYLGYSDWRLPNVKELQSIVDYSGVYPAIDETLFTITDPDSYFWTSTSAYFSPESPGYYYAWYVAFGYAVDADGADSHGAGAVRFDTKEEGGPAGEEPERVYNYARLVRDS